MLAGAYKISNGRQDVKLETPNYVVEVIIPIITLLAAAMPQEKVIIPDAGTYALLGDHFRITIGLTVVGGLSYPTKDDHKL